MRKLFVLAMLCIVSINCVELENICSSDTFIYDGEYDDVLVNSFHRVRLNITFRPLSYYLIPDDIKCDLGRFENKSNYYAGLQAKNKYNRKFLDLYTVDLEGATPEELQTRELDLRTSAWLPLRELTQKDSRAQCLWDYETTAFRGYSIFQDLERVVLTDRNAGYSDASYRPYTGDLVDQLKEWMEEVDRNGTDVQKFAFSWEKAGDIFTRKQIVLFRGFKFLTGDSGQVQSDTKSRLFSEHFLPFFNKNHTDENCVSVKDLPKFYKNKGVDERQR